jgi:hypothetical protein
MAARRTKTPIANRCWLNIMIDGCDVDASRIPYQ